MFGIALSLELLLQFALSLTSTASQSRQEGPQQERRRATTAYVPSRQRAYLYGLRQRRVSMHVLQVHVCVQSVVERSVYVIKKLKSVIAARSDWKRIIQMCIMRLRSNQTVIVTSLQRATQLYYCHRLHLLEWRSDASREFAPPSTTAAAVTICARPLCGGRDYSGLR